MIRIAFRGTTREHLLALAIVLLLSAFCLLLSGVPAHGADQTGLSFKPYNPFDDPKPALPREMTADKRLDLKVKLYATSRNLRDLLDDLSRVSGVKLFAEPKLQAEQPIVFVRSKPLRTVMTELSGFYGCEWTARSGVGGYSYELREPAGRDRLKARLVEEGGKRANAMLLDFTKKYLKASPDDPKMKEIGWADSNAFQSLFGPNGKLAMAMLSAAGEDLLARSLSGDGVTMTFSEASPEFQSAICDWINGMNDMARRWRSEDAPPPSADPAGMASARISIKRADPGPSGVSRFEFSVSAEGRPPQSLQWPFYQIRFEDMDTIAGWSAADKSFGSGLPSKVRVTPAIPKTRLWFTTADILQAVAEQSGLDVISESPRQEQQQGLFAGVPLNTLISRICRDNGLACRADSGMIRLRRSQWYSQQVAELIPAKLLESCWKDLETTGKLGTANLVALANLSPEQALSVQLRDMPGARDALRNPDAIRLWAALSESADGVPVSKLTREQKAWLDGLLASRSSRSSTPPVKAEDVEKAVISVTTERPSGNSGYSRSSSEYQQLTLKAGDQVIYAYPVFLSSPLSDADRKMLIDMRRSDKNMNIIQAVR